MAQHVEPMDVDDIEGHFDNKENTYHHSNVQARTPCTEKGYEELDVSELNMKLRYSMTPANSPMSKSMSYCFDNKYNTSTDESLNNTVVNENENNLTRSLNSALNKNDVKSPKMLPLQVLPTELVDSNRNSTVLQSLDTTVNNNVTITVANENEIDNLSFPSSSSSMTHTPEATTPTKEVLKNDVGSPIMRGLKSVLSMFRSSQSPIPPGEIENKAVVDTVLDPVDVPLPDSKPQTDTSTPLNQKTKERSLSRRNSPYKDSVVFNEDLEKELQWNDDSSIVFSTEKIPIHKLFFQDKPSSFKSQKLCPPEKEEDVNSSVEYMDISYNDLSIRDRTLNATLNKSKINDNLESDGEFLDCETTFTQNESIHREETAKSMGDVTHEVPVEDLVENIAVVNQQSMLYVTQDILNLIDSSEIVEEAGVAAKQLDFSTTDIVNQLSDLINASENIETNVSKIDSSNVYSGKTESQKPIDGPKQTVVQPEVLDNQVISPENLSILENNLKSSMVVKNVSIDIVDKPKELTNVVIETVDNSVELVLPEVSSVPSEAVSQIAHEVTSQESKEKETQKDNISKNNFATHPSPVDIPLPSEDDFNSINDNFVEEKQFAALEEYSIPVVNTSQSELMAALDRTTEENLDINVIQVETDNLNKNPCQPSLLPSDVSLPNTDDHDQSRNNDNLPHEAITAVPDLALPQASETPVISSVDCAFKCDSIDHIQVTLLTKNAAFEDSNIMTENGPTCDIIQSAEEKIEIYFADKTTDFLPETLAMEVSTIGGASSDERETSTNLENTFAHVEQSQEENQSLNIAGELPVVQIKHVVVDVVEDSSKAAEQNREVIVDSVTEPITDEDFTVNNASKTSDELNNIVASENSKIGDSKVFENVDPLLNPNMLHAITSSELEISQPLPNLSETPLVEKKPSDLPNSTEAETVIKESENLAVENLGVTTTNVNVKCPLSTQSSDVLIPTETPIIENTSEVSKDAANNENTSEIEDKFNVINNVDTTVNVDKPSQLAENIDEEIVASENNSPFVSVSAEDAFDSETRKEYSENIDNTSSIKDQPQPPVSPKIVSKGYNFNFDEIDNINPFTTKAKIRMSPPPGSSPNASLENVIEKKTEKVVPLNRATNANRRKTMPERKVPLKAKRHFNSTFDSTEKALTTQSKPKIEDDSSTSKINADIEQVDSQTLTDKVQTDIDAVLPAQEDIHTLDATKLDVITQDVTKARTTHNEDNSEEDAKVTLDEVIIKSENASTIVEDVILNGRQKSSVKSDNTSSSEHSTYFSAGTSSTEGESKNVFNLPEIDGKDFNPFATKSKIRQTPSPELDMVNPFASKSKLKSSPETSFITTHKDANATVVIDSDEINNLSDCSGISEASVEKDVTVQEVHTEDEDTIEGPFLEAEDESDKISEIGDSKENMVEINNINAHVNDDNTDAAEMFIDAEAFEFLMNQNKDDEVAYSGKESLFLKFDPLFARRVTSEGVAAALSEIKGRQSTPKKIPQPVLLKEEPLSFEKPVAGTFNLNVTHESQSSVNESREDMNVTVSKPMMVVPPAVYPVVTPRQPSTPNRTNRLSMTFTSPAMAVIDRLLSLSGNSPSAGLDATVTHVTREHNEADQVLTQLRELLAEKEINVYNLRCESKELKDRLSTLETQMKSLEAESADRLKKINELGENLVEKTKRNKSMAAVVEEYERTIASLISETEQDKKRYAEERDQLIRERDEQSTHLASMEVSFNDLHSKYEKSKQVIMGYKSNEDAYKSSLKEFEENLAKMHTNYELLKQHATSKLNHANQELEKLNKAHEAEVCKFNAMIKRKDLHITSLEESLAQKTKANEELTAICDELINKVG